MELSLDLPPKSLFKTEEICALLDIRPYVLRFWESEFEDLSPIISATGQKLYERGEIEKIVFIKKQLYDCKYSIEKARQELKNHLKALGENVKEELLVKQEMGHINYEKLKEAYDKLLEVKSTLDQICLNHAW